MAEQADARDSKSRGLSPCGFDSHLRHVGSQNWAPEVRRGVLGREMRPEAPLFTSGSAEARQKRAMSEQMHRLSHSPRLPAAITRAAFGVIFGLAVGFAIGWWLWPVQYTNTAPIVLRQDYHDDYIVMIATSHEVDKDLEQAQRRLRLLDPQEPAAPVVELSEKLVQVKGSTEDIARLARLAQALGALTPTLAPYLEGQQ